MTIPKPKPGQRGWSVESDGTLHLRYQDHAPARRVATEQGVRTVLDGTPPKVCPTCFPDGGKAAPDMEARRGQRRRK